MSLSISDAMKSLNITITQQRIDEMIRLVILWELRYPLALNSQGLGIHPIVFTDTDREALFNIFGVDQKQVKNLIQRCSAINAEFKVINDPLAILSFWLLHLGYTSIPDPKKREEFQLAVAKYLHYRFFTSLVNHSYPYRAVEKYMNAAVSDLSRKFDVVTYGTWKASIEARCYDLISPGSLHSKTIELANNDKNILYVITDIQGRIRDRVKNINIAYYKAREQGDMIGSRSSTIETEDGKILVQSNKTLDMMIFNLQNEIMVERLFIDNETVRQITTQFIAITPDMLKTALTALVSIADTQRDSNQLDLTKVNDGVELYVGIRVFLSNFIRKTYRYCMKNGVDVTNKAAVYVKVKNVYSSSRINNDDIQSIKQSVAYFVDLISSSRRETTKSSLRICLILYILIRSFRFI